MMKLTDTNKIILSTDFSKEKTDPRDLLQEYVDLVHDNLNNNSKKALKSDLNCYQKFCRINQFIAFPDNLSEAKTVSIKYFAFLIDKPLARTTIRRRLASIQKFYRILEYRNPFKESEALRDHIRLRLNKLPGSRQMKPIRHSDVIKLASVNEQSTLMDIRNSMIAYIGIYTLARASELLILKVKDVDLITGTIFIERSKNDQSAEGRYANLSPKTVDIISLWIKKSKLQANDILYRKINRYDQAGKPLSYNGLRFLYQNLAEAVVENTELIDFATHSLRIGSAVSMAEKGVSLAEIALAGGWKTNTMPLHYTKQANAKKIGTVHFED